ncbi:primase-helicase family protein [Chryseobacterium binzhouense]|uniref:primase-helicase family protein n=1 Tax=Chryseobacterium binzhouense TaxID=2593646 RepID=UPI00117EA934|nr:primase-helicase family protein [Chryseobacterium binzhouense]
MRKVKIPAGIILVPWYIVDGKYVRIKTIDFLNFLVFLNIMVAKIGKEREYVFIENNIIRIIEVSDIVQMLLQWLDENFVKFEAEVPIDDVKEAFIIKSSMLFDKTTLFFLKEIEFKQKFDSKDESYLYFLNTAVKVNRDGIDLIKYKDLEWLIMDEQVVKRNFFLPKKAITRLIIPYQIFIWNIAGQDEVRYKAFMSVIGYLLHRYQDAANAKAINLLDETEETDLAEGGRGKSLFVKAIGFMVAVCALSGKDFTGNNIFAFQRVSRYTAVLLIDDAGHNLRFEVFYNRITDGFTVNVKYKQEYHIPFEESPKVVITSNHILKALAGNSTDRRRYEIELSSHYGKDLTVYDDFGHYFFTDWDQRQWDEFTLYMLSCVQLYLTEGLIEAPSIHLNERRLVSELGIEFLDFMEEELQGKTKLHKKELFSKFSKGGYVNQRYLPNQRTFTTKVKKYLEYKQIPYREIPLNTKMYFEILSEKDLKPMITIDSVDTDYRTVDTANKLTRLVNQLQKFFSTDNTTKN